MITETSELPVEPKTILETQRQNTPLQEQQERFSSGHSPARELLHDIQAGKNFIKAMVEAWKSPQMEKDRKSFPHFMAGITATMMGFFELEKEVRTGDSWGGPGSITAPSERYYENLSWTSKDFPMLENTGNLFESYMLSYLTYYGLSLITKNKLSPVARVGISWLASVGVVVAMETGKLSIGTPDLLDIPAGILGPTIFAGIMLANKEFIAQCGKAIDDVKLKIQKMRNDNGNLGSLTETEELSYALATASESSTVDDSS